MLAMFLTIFALGVVLSGTALMDANQSRTETQFLLHGQATNFARSGLTEALNWMRRQPTQPVTVFAPLQDISTTPPIEDTLEPDIGLVREFQITGSLWGRYEVWKQWDADPIPARLAWRQQVQARDISSQRQVDVTGGVWGLTCVSYVYRLKDSGQPFDQLPNRILATEQMSTEVSRLSLTLPGQAALCARTASTVSVGSSGQVDGGASAAGIFSLQGTGTPVVTGTVTGTPATSSVATYDDSLAAVFGVTEDSLRAMADDQVTDFSLFPNPVPDDSLLFVDVGPVVFDSTTPLRGSGITYIKGDVTIAASSNSFFSGLLYVEGDLSIGGPCDLLGAVVVTGSVSVGGGSDLVTLTYSDTLFDNLQDVLGNYRISRSVIRANRRD